MTRVDIEKFIKWLKDHEMYIAGDTYQVLLGVYRPMPLHKDDYAMVIDDFLKEQVDG